MTERKNIQLWIAVSEIGDSRMSWDSAADAIDELRDNDGFEAVRVVMLNVAVDLPTVEVVNVDVAVPPQTIAPAQVSVA